MMKGDLSQYRLLELHVSGLEKSVQAIATILTNSKADTAAAISSVKQELESALAKAHKRTRQGNRWGVALLALVGTLVTVGGSIYNVKASNLSHDETVKTCEFTAETVVRDSQEKSETLLMKYETRLIDKLDKREQERHLGAPMIDRIKGRKP